MKRFLLLSIGLVLAAPLANAAFNDIVSYFQDLNDADTTYPVPAKTYDDIDSAFGPRKQVSVGGTYDWHRGMDIDGGSVGDPVGIYDIVAATDGTFYDYRTSFSGGNIIILRHDFDVQQSYGGQALDYYYTWYLHLYDDGVGGTNDSADITAGWTSIVDGGGTPTAVPVGTKLGVMGDSGSPGGGGTYAPHLHFELRVGSNASLDFQLDNLGTTQWGFDPHVNPMLLFDPYDYGNGVGEYELTVGLSGTVEPLEDITIDAAVTNDDMPVFDEVVVVIRDKATETEQESHTLGLNQREGFDATTNENLDVQDKSLPYIEPLDFLTSDTDWATSIVLPTDWTAGYDTDYEVVVTVKDIWGNTESTTFGLVPEPQSWATLVGLLGLLAVGAMRRR